MSLRITQLPSAVAALVRALAGGIRQERLRTQVHRAFPHVHFEWPINFVVDSWEVETITIEPGGFIGPYSEIVVLKQSPFTTVAGGLVIGRGVRIGMGANIRAAGGVIRIGHNTQIGQHVSLIGSNHLIDPATRRPDAAHWDTIKTGVTIGENCWIGAGVVILPGVVIGNGTVVGAGSVVTRSVGENQICHGNPARPAQLPPS